ncbi:MAG: hypothetical protein ACRCVV_19040 [Shewanella sp.]
MTKQDFINMGGKEWNKDSMSRVYINADQFNEICGTALSDKTNKFFFDCNTNALMRSYKGKKPQVEVQYSAEVVEVVKAHEIANELGLVKATGGYECFTQNELSNDDLIEAIQSRSVKVCGNQDDELYVFSDGSCINRQGEEYFLNDDVDKLAQEYLDSVGY